MSGDLETINIDEYQCAERSPCKKHPHHFSLLEEQKEKETKKKKGKLKVKVKVKKNKNRQQY